MGYSRKKRRCGVYTITNVTNGKIYLGSSVDCLERWNQHKKSLRANRHYNKHLQAAWNKYKESGFLFEIIEITDLYLQREQELIKQMNLTDPKIGYNIYSEVKGGKRKRPVLQYDSNGVFLKKWDSVKTAADELSILATGIVSCCRLKTHRSHGYIWRYYEGEIISKISPHIKRPSDIKIFVFNMKCKLLYEFDSFRLVADALNLNESSVRKAESRHNGSCNKMIFVRHTNSDQAFLIAKNKILSRYDPTDNLRVGIMISAERRQVAVLKCDIDGNLIKEFKSVKMAGLSVDRSPSAILNAIKKDIVCCGFKWKYKS